MVMPKKQHSEPFNPRRGNGSITKFTGGESMDFAEFLPGVFIGTGIGALGYIVGGVAAPYVAGVSAPAYAALGFLLGLGSYLVAKK